MNTEAKIAKITCPTLSVLIYVLIPSITCSRRSFSLSSLTKATPTEAPKSSKTIEIVVEVGSPIVLKKSNRTISASMTAAKITISSSK